MDSIKYKHKTFEDKRLEYIEKVYQVGEGEPEKVIIWLHGLGADFNDFVPIMSQLKLKNCVKFIFPNAPFRPITINNGHETRAWFDIRDLSSLDSAVDREGIRMSVHLIDELIGSLIKSGYKSEHIIVAGFSQGGVIAYNTLLYSKYNLGGIIALSCYLPTLNLSAKEFAVQKDKKTPIIACHGKQDMVVPYEVGLNAYNALRDAGFYIMWLSYTMDHGVCEDELRDIELWLHERFI